MASSTYADAAVATIVTTQAVAIAEPRRSHTRAGMRLSPRCVRTYRTYVCGYVPYVSRRPPSRLRSGPIARQPPRRARSTLSKEAARARYVEMGELAALEQIREDAKA